jgi:hypothetical protein
MTDPQKDDARTGAVPVFGPKSQTPPQQEQQAPPPPPPPASTQNGQPPQAQQPTGPIPGQPHRTAAHLNSAPQPVFPHNGMPQKSGTRVWPFLVGGGGLIALILIIVLVSAITNLSSPDGGSVDTAQDSPAEEAAEDTEPDPADALDGQDLSPEEKLESIKDTSWDAYSDELDGQWVVQLSSKKEGLEADGYTWTDSDIVDHYESIHEEYPDAILLWSGDWSSYDSSDFWVIVRAAAYPDSDSALDFCYEEGFGSDDCMAKHLYISGAPDDTSEYMS